MSAPSDWHSRDSSPRAARSVSRAARTLPLLRGARIALIRAPVVAGRQRTTGRMRTAARALARVVVLGGHRGHQPVEAGLPGELRVEGRGQDVALADRDDAAVVEPGQDVHVGPGPFDDRRPDEHARGPASSPRTGTSSSDSNESSWRPNALRSTVTSSSGRMGGSPPAISARQDDHPGARAEDRGAAIGQVEDRLVEAPALDELAHRRALATRQDEPADALQVGRLAHAHTVHPDRVKRVEVLSEGPLQGQDSDPHDAGRAGRCLTSPSRRGAPGRGSPRARSRASALRGPWRPRRSSSGRRRTWSPARWRWPSGPGPRS